MKYSFKQKVLVRTFFKTEGASQSTVLTIDRNKTIKDLLQLLFEKKKLKHNKSEFYLVSEYNEEALEEDEVDEDEVLQLNTRIEALKRSELIVFC